MSNNLLYMKKISIVLTALLAVACAQTQPPKADLASHVILIGLDGWGKGVKKNHEIKETVIQMDLAATVAHILNLPQPQ